MKKVILALGLMTLSPIASALPEVDVHQVFQKPRVTCNGNSGQPCQGFTGVGNVALEWFVEEICDDDELCRNVISNRTYVVHVDVTQSGPDPEYHVKIDVISVPQTNQRIVRVAGVDMMLFDGDQNEGETGCSALH